MTSITKALKLWLVITQLCFFLKVVIIHLEILQDFLGPSITVFGETTQQRGHLEARKGLAMNQMKRPGGKMRHRHMPSSRSSRGNSSPAYGNQPNTLPQIFEHLL